jgi:pyroglutamyl-peptidase
MQNKKKILITGFEPFDKFTFNPSGKIAEIMNDEESEFAVIDGIILPVDTKRVQTILEDKITSFDPDVIISLGLAARRKFIALEKIAINLLDFDIPDNSGNIPEDTWILHDAPLAYKSNLPYKSIKKSLEAEKIPASISYSAGAYLCNQVFYLVMDYINRTKEKKKLGGFIHIPQTIDMLFPEEDKDCCLTQDQELKAVKIICKITSESI